MVSTKGNDLHEKKAFPKRNGFHYGKWLPLKRVISTNMNWLPIKGIASNKGNVFHLKEQFPLNEMISTTGHWFSLKIMASTKRYSFD